jgi:hypothetical protein
MAAAKAAAIILFMAFILPVLLDNLPSLPRAVTAKLFKIQHLQTFMASVYPTPFRVGR